MTQPESAPVHDRSHAHVDLDDLMDGSERGPQEPEPRPRSWRYGEAAELSGETVDGYVTGQDEGSID